MDYYLSRIQSTTNSIKEFKVEQERLILNTQHSTQGSQGVLTIAHTHHNCGHQDSTCQATLNKIINTDCILMPHCTEKTSHRKLWPQALVANRLNSCAEIGLIESYGSLWKLIPIGESGEGSIVVLQCSERGENARYLSADLDLVEMKVDAAPWRVRISSVRTSTADDKSTCADLLKGVLVVFELVTSAAAGDGRGNSQVLVCETSVELRNYSELFVEQVAQLPETAGLGQEKPFEMSEHRSKEECEHPTYHSFHWEVLPEAWIMEDSGLEGSGLDFLQGFIN